MRRIRELFSRLTQPIAGFAVMGVGLTLVLIGIFSGMDRDDLAGGVVLFAVGVPLTFWLVRRWQASLIHE